jgi:LmbE family N-acetylglucosaminyl deacetylase
MATLVCFHAHPDDEAIATSGTMMKAKIDGHRVVLVFATRGELGETERVPAGVSLADHRVEECHKAAAIIGADRVEFLPFRDSGMADDPRIDDDGTFHSAPLDVAAEALATILREERADVLTVYDERGNYGHPDHIKVHHVGYRAAELAGVSQVYENTINREYLVALLTERPGDLAGIDAPDPEEMDLGMPEARITHWVDVGDFIERKRQAIAVHASQVDETSFFLTMPDDAFKRGFGYEWYIHRGSPTGRKPDIV